MKKIASIIILMMLSIVTYAQTATIDGSSACFTAPGCPKYICANDTMALVAGITSGSIDSVKWRESISTDGGTTWSTWALLPGVNLSQRVPSSGLSNTTTRYQYWVRVYQGTQQYWAFADVFVDAAPTAILVSNDTSVCPGTSVAFSASGGINYHYKVNGISKQNDTTSTFTSTTLGNHDTITVTVTNASGCSTTSSPIIMTVYPKPEATNVVANTISTPGCVGQTTNVNITGLKGTGPWSLEVWNTSGGNPTTLYYSIGTVSTANPSAQGIIVPAIGANNLFLGVTDSHGCKNKP